jgi:hypothetical protein
MCVRPIQFMKDGRGDLASKLISPRPGRQPGRTVCAPGGGVFIVTQIFGRSTMNRLCASILAVGLITGSGTSAQSADRPFQAELSGAYSEFARGYEVLGHVTHLGNSQAVLGLRHSPQVFFRFLLDIFRDDPVARSSQAFVVAADGSVLMGIIRYDDFDAGTLMATGEFTFIGGTGRFAEVVGAVDVLLLFSGETLLDCDVLMDGTLDY